MSGHSVRLIKGGDDVVRANAVRDAVKAAVGEADRSLVLEELTEDTYRVEEQQFEIARLVDAAQTPPFLTDYRVVVGRHLGVFPKADDVAALVAYLGAPLESTRLVLAWEKAPSASPGAKTPAVPKSLAAAIEAAGGSVVEATVPGGRGAAQWLDAQLAESTMQFEAKARRLIADQFGEDRSRVLGLVEVLESAFGSGAALGPDDVRPYLSDKGSVPPWDLTDAIDKGDPATAIDKLHRMMGAGDRHALQIMASLHTHMGRIMRLDGEVVRDEKAAAQVLGMKGSTFPAKKAMAQSRRLGSDKIRR
ncbi:MAG: hypothetical protein HKN26_08635, partial [Acidimicrobiales bacterium]|nr:hypothetical protein [Acidimicrobiales bacterium]